MKHTTTRSMVLALAPRFLLPALGAVFLLTAPGAYADGTPNAAANAKKSQIQEMQKHLRDVQDKLTKIQEDTAKNDPDIKKQEDDFQAYLDTVMKSLGYTPDEDMKKVDKLSATIQDKKTSSTDRARTMLQYLRVKRHYQEGERKALYDPKVQVRQKTLQEAMVAAMKKHDASTQSLLDDMQKTEQKLQALAAGS